MKSTTPKYLTRFTRVKIVPYVGPRFFESAQLEVPGPEGEPVDQVLQSHQDSIPGVPGLVTPVQRWVCFLRTLKVLCPLVISLRTAQTEITMEFYNGASIRHANK